MAKTTSPGPMDLGRPGGVRAQYHVRKGSTTPTNNRAFWVRRLNGNAARDRMHARSLAEMGWRSIVVWECEVERDLGGLRGRL